MQQVVFHLLGPPDIFCRGPHPQGPGDVHATARDQPVPIKIPRRRSRALLYYMVSTHTPQPRERLLNLLCGEMDEEGARHAFKTMLAEVRAHLRTIDASIDWIISDGDHLTFNPRAPIWLDTEVFEKDAGAQSRHVSHALTLYRGDFLDGFFLKDAPDFESWVQSTRDHFRHLYLSALRHLAEVDEANHQLDEAISCMHLFLSADPFAEEAHTYLMQLLWQAGDRIGALRQYEKLSTLLMKEFSVQPSTATRALYQRIAQPPVEGSALPVDKSTLYSNKQSPVELPAMVGREKEMVWIRRHLMGLENPLLLICGEMGSGKTRLMQALVQRLENRWIDRYPHWSTAHISCRRADGKSRYYPIAEILRSSSLRERIASVKLPEVWRAQLVNLVPDLFVDEHAPLMMLEPTVLADALVALLGALASARRPLLLIFEDVHWADEETLALLAHCVHALQHTPLFLLGSYVPGIADAHVELLHQENEWDTLELPPLAIADVEMITRSALSNTTSRYAFEDVEEARVWSEDEVAFVSKWCYRQSEGNPFFVLAWLSHDMINHILALRVQDHNTDSRPDDVVLAVPDTIERMVDTQLRLLDRDEMTFVSVAAYLGEAFQLGAVIRLLQFDMHVALMVADELLKRKIIMESVDEGWYRFVHRAVRTVVLGRMTRGQLSLLQNMENHEL